MSSVPPTQTSIASAVNNALSRLAGLLAVSLLALVLAHGFVSTLSNQLAHSSLPAEAREQMLANQARLHDIPIPPGLTQPQRTQAAQLLDQAFLSGFHSVMLACALSAWAGGLAVLLLLPKQPAKNSMQRVREARYGHPFRLDTRRVPQVSPLRPGILLAKANRVRPKTMKGAGF